MFPEGAEDVSDTTVPHGASQPLGSGSEDDPLVTVLRGAAEMLEGISLSALLWKRLVEQGGARFSFGVVQHVLTL